MDNDLVVASFSALAQPTRLDVFKLLVRNEPHGMPAGEIARQLDVPHNTMSSHLAILTRSGLISVERHSRSMIYRAELPAIHKLVLFVLRDCCSGKPGLCAPLVQDISACCSSEGARCA